MTDAELCNLARNGDRAAAAEMYRRYLGMLCGIARSYARRVGMDELDDIQQAGAIGVLRAVEAFDPTRGAFSTLAAMAVRNAIVAWLRAGLRIGRKCSESPVDGIGELATVDADPGARLESLDAAEQAAVALDAIERPDWRQLVIDRFGLAGSPPMTLQQLGDARGVTRERINQIIGKALKVARRKLNGLQLNASLRQARRRERS